MKISDLWIELKKCNLDQLQNIKYHIQTMITNKKDELFMSKLSVYQKQIVEDYKKEYHNLQWDAEHCDTNNAISVFQTYSLFEFSMEGDYKNYIKMSDEAFTTFHKKFIEWKNKQRGED
jgi:hypothetical protein